MRQTLNAMFSKKRFVAFAKGIAAVLIAAGVAGALRGHWALLRDLAGQLDLRWLGVAAGAALVYRVLNAAGWGMILRALGHPLPLLAGVRLWLIAETMRWLPGSVWGFSSRVYQAQKAGVPAVTASLSLPLELAVTVVAWVLAALMGGTGMGQVFAGWKGHVPRVSFLWVTLGLGFLFAFGVVARRRGFLRGFARKAGGFLHDLQRTRKARPRPVMLLGTLTWFVALCILNGLAFHALLRAFAPAAMPSVRASIGINAIGWLLGFFAVFSPGGLGVREAGMTALLFPAVPMPVAVGSVVVWRAIQILVEVACLGACYLPGAVRFARRRVWSRRHVPGWVTHVP